MGLQTGTVEQRKSGGVLVRDLFMSTSVRGLSLCVQLYTRYIVKLTNTGGRIIVESNFASLKVFVLDGIPTWRNLFSFRRLEHHTGYATVFIVHRRVRRRGGVYMGN